MRNLGQRLINTLRSVGMILIVLISGGLVSGMFYEIWKYRHYNPPQRAMVADVKSDLRWLATAIESYALDHLAYPAWDSNLDINMFSTAQPMKLAIHHQLERQPTFMLPAKNGFPKTMTTPVAYLSTYVQSLFTH